VAEEQPQHEGRLQRQGRDRLVVLAVMLVVVVVLVVLVVLVLLAVSLLVLLLLLLLALSMCWTRARMKQMPPPPYRRPLRCLSAWPAG
jgi:Flp pilus assembly protein TadB